MLPLHVFNSLHLFLSTLRCFLQTWYCQAQPKSQPSLAELALLSIDQAEFWDKKNRNPFVWKKLKFDRENVVQSCYNGQSNIWAKSGPVVRRCFFPVNMILNFFRIKFFEKLSNGLIVVLTLIVFKGNILTKSEPVVRRFFLLQPLWFWYFFRLNSLKSCLMV